MLAHATGDLTSKALIVSVREREREFKLPIQPALVYEDMSMLEASAKVRMAAKQ